MMIESIWYFIIAVMYLAIGAYTMYVYMEPAWNKGFDDGWNSGIKSNSDHEKWYMYGWNKGWDDCVDKMDYMKHFNRGFEAGWKANGSITDERIKGILKEMVIK